jgi:hypothetical protein
MMELALKELDYDEYVVIAVSDLKRPNHIDPRSEVVVETHDFIFQHQVFLFMELLNENISVHVLLYPLKNKK